MVLLILSNYSCLAHITTTPTNEQHIKIFVFNQNQNDPLHPKGVIKEVSFNGNSLNWGSDLLVRDEDELWFDVKKYTEWNKDKQKFIDQPFFNWKPLPGLSKLLSKIWSQKRLSQNLSR